MATLQSDIALAKGKLGVAGLTDPTTYQGTLHIATAVVDLGSTLAANDIIELCTVPAGSRVVPALSNAICHADPGTALVLDIGNSADTDRYSDGLTLSSGGVVNFLTPAIPAAVSSPARLDEATLVYATVMTATTITANSKITFNIAYVTGN